MPFQGCEGRMTGTLDSVPVHSSRFFSSLFVFTSTFGVRRITVPVTSFDEETKRESAFHSGTVSR